MQQAQAATPLIVLRDIHKSYNLGLPSQTKVPSRKTEVAIYASISISTACQTFSSILPNFFPSLTLSTLRI